MDISDEGQPLDPAWLDADNNVCGVLTGVSNVSSVAERFVAAGWNSRSSSWEGYEIETGWCRVEIDPTGGDTLLNGVVDPRRFEDLAVLLTRCGTRFVLELYGDDGELLREIKTGAPSASASASASQAATPRAFRRLLAPLGRLRSGRGGRRRGR
ncbi:hypothetical protein [Streptomyces sp. NPDC048659]|uniref:hypothetical protein n=1 Tax=Streptomyces sp. NPDC048659 TaxID=3155489 RepID=UPI00342E0149